MPPMRSGLQIVYFTSFRAEKKSHIIFSISLWRRQTMCALVFVFSQFCSHKSFVSSSSPSFFLFFFSFSFNFNGHLDCNLWSSEHIILPLMATNNNKKKINIYTIACSICTVYTAHTAYTLSLR